jgi:hypothetical protein
MKKTGPLPLLSLLVALPAAAQVVSMGDMAGFKEALKNSDAPAVPTSRAIETAGLTRVACPVLSLNGATVGRGLFENDYTVKIGGEEVGKVESGGSGMRYTAGGAGQADISFSFNGEGGRRATVVGCDGETIGSVYEMDSHDASRFRIEDAAGRPIAHSGDVDGTSWVMAGPGVSASITNDHWLVDRYALSMSGIDGRLVLTAAIMNNQALYRRADERRRENPREPHEHEPHGDHGRGR